MFRAGLLIIMSRFYSVYSVFGIVYVMRLCWLAVGRSSIPIQPTSSELKSMTYTNCCIYTVVPPDDEQYACSKHVEANYWNKFTEKNAPCWFLLYRYITMHGQQNNKFMKKLGKD